MAMLEDDEIILIFIEESKEHLDGIEADLLDIESMGADVDTDLVNRVFRAIHSIKGGAGFLGFERIKELTHSMENLLNMIRSGNLVPTSRLISVLLEGADVLKNLISDYQNSNQVDLSSILKSLENVTVEALPAEEKKLVTEKVEIRLPGGALFGALPKLELEQALKGGRRLYIVSYDMLNDIERRGKNPLKILSEIEQTGLLIETRLELPQVGGLEDFSTDFRMSLSVLLATVLEDDIIPNLLQVDRSKIFKVDPTGHLEQIAGLKGGAEKSSPEPATVPEPALPDTPTDYTEDDLAVKFPMDYEEDEFIETPVYEIPEPVSVREPEPIASRKPVAVSKQLIPAGGEEKSRAALDKQINIGTASSTIRVNVKVLDELMTLAGELVLTRNQLLQNVAKTENNQFEQAVQRLDLVTSELQEAVMATRMQPISNVFNKFQRVVRDLSEGLGKEVELHIEGKDVELDKTIIEAIGDPLVHLVRNAVDHGIETPEERLRRGKPKVGNLFLKASHEAGQVNIEINDDGAGIDPQKIKAKALEQELVEPHLLNSMNEKEIIRLIFKPGFSTASVVTDVSGRGVGMDVVQNNLSMLGGTIDINSTIGKGSHFLIKLPLTLAIIPSLIVEVEENRYAIPQVNLVELVRITADQIKKRIEIIDDAAVMRLRGELLPLIHLADALHMLKTYLSEHRKRKPSRRRNLFDRRSPLHSQASQKAADNENTPEANRRNEAEDRRQDMNSAYNVVVVNAGDFTYGIVVDHLLDSEEIVVKPLGTHLRDIKTYAGATILGDGKATLILDIMGISQALNLKNIKQKSKNFEKSKDTSANTDLRSLVLLRNAANEQFAVPLGFISRIEKISRNDIVLTSGRQAIKYRGQNLILFSIEDVAKVGPREQVDWPFVLIFPYAGRDVGLVVSRIVDVIDIDLKIDDETFRQPGIMGSAIIEDHITLFLDPYEIVSVSMPEWTTKKLLEADKSKKKARKEQFTVLLVEDSTFFLNQVKNFTQTAGYEVITALNGVEGLAKLNDPELEIDIVLTDIEMPEMDGVEMTRKLRQNKKWADLPVIALTSVAGTEAEERAFAAGIRKTNMSANETAGGVLELTIFKVDDLTAAIPTSFIREINRHMSITKVSNAPDNVRGILNLRGDIITVIDLRQVFGLTVSEINNDSRIIVVHYNTEDIGLLVDKVLDIKLAAEDQMEASPANLNGVNGAFFTKIFKMEEDLAAILNIRDILNPEVILN